MTALQAGVLTRREWRWGEKIRAVEVLSDLLTWIDGDYTFFRTAAREAGEFRLTIPRLVLELFLRSRDRGLVLHHLGGVDVPLVRDSRFDAEFSTFGLTDDAESVVRLIDGESTAAEISERGARRHLRRREAPRRARDTRARASGLRHPRVRLGGAPDTPAATRAAGEEPEEATAPGGRASRPHPRARRRGARARSRHRGDGELPSPAEVADSREEDRSLRPRAARRKSWSTRRLESTGPEYDADEESDRLATDLEAHRRSRATSGIPPPSGAGRPTAFDRPLDLTTGVGSLERPRPRSSSPLLWVLGPARRGRRGVLYVRARGPAGSAHPTAAAPAPGPTLAGKRSSRPRRNGRADGFASRRGPSPTPDADPCAGDRPRPPGARRRPSDAPPGHAGADEARGGGGPVETRPGGGSRPLPQGMARSRRARPAGAPLPTATPASRSSSNSRAKCPRSPTPGHTTGRPARCGLSRRPSRAGPASGSCGADTRPARRRARARVGAPPSSRRLATTRWSSRYADGPLSATLGLTLTPTNDHTGGTGRVSRVPLRDAPAAGSAADLPGGTQGNPDARSRRRDAPSLLREGGAAHRDLVPRRAADRRFPQAPRLHHRLGPQLGARHGRQTGARPARQDPRRSRARHAHRARRRDAPARRRDRLLDLRLGVRRVPASRPRRECSTRTSRCRSRRPPSSSKASGACRKPTSSVSASGTATGSRSSRPTRCRATSTCRWRLRRPICSRGSTASSTWTRC